MTHDSKKEIRFAWSEIDLKALAHNIKLIRSYRSGNLVKIMAVVKANAYGHGALRVSRTVLESGADALGVALAEEGIQLREQGIEAPIYILGECPATAAGYAMENNLILTVNSTESAKVYSDIASSRNIKASVNINIDTGMNRLGINWKDIQDISIIMSRNNLAIDGIFSHFSCASEGDPAHSRLQMERFSKALEKLSSTGFNTGNVHFANSAAFFRFRDSHFNMARMGISIYGLNPYDNGWEGWLPESAKEAVMGLKPVLSLKSRISFIKKIGAGEPVSYCGTFRTERDSVIATIPVGYADGYSRILSNRSNVLINGHEAPVVGNITMDQFMVDITDVPGNSDIKAGDEVVLIGKSGDKEIRAEDIAEILGTINYEVTCMIKNRIPKVYKD